MLAVFGVFSPVKLPRIDGANDRSENAEEVGSKLSLLHQPHFTWGIVMQFQYIAARVNAFAVNYVIENAIVKDTVGVIWSIRCSHGMGVKGLVKLGEVLCGHEFDFIGSQAIVFAFDQEGGCALLHPVWHAGVDR